MLEGQVRRVLAGYIEDPDQGSSYRSMAKSWMEHEESKNKDQESPEASPILKGIKKDTDTDTSAKSDLFGEKGVLYNPYDYKDPSTSPKDLKDGGPYINEVAEIPNGFSFNSPSLFKEDGALYEWYKSRREDWTADPTEQNPAFSLDRKYAGSLQRVVSRFLLDDTPIQTSVRVKTAASLVDIGNMFKGGDPEMYSSTAAKASNISGVVWQNQSNKDQTTKGLYHFTVPSSSGSGSYNVYLQFLRTKDKKETPRGYLDFDVELSCSCSSFLFFGAQYYAVQGKYMYMPGFRPSLLPPHARTQTVSITKSTGPQLMGEEKGKGRINKGKGLNFRMCKHLISVLDYVKNNFRVEETAARKNYPLVGRPSYIINKERWEEVFKFPFTLESIKKQLTSGLSKVPNFYRTVYTREKRHYDQVDVWVRDVFDKLPSAQRVAYLRFLVEHPEEIFYILWRHSVDIYPSNIDPILVSTGFRLMDKTVKSKSAQSPEDAVEDTGSKDKDIYKGPNMTGPIQPVEVDSPDTDTEEEGKTFGPTKPSKVKSPAEGPDEEPEDDSEESPKVKKFQPLKGKRISPAIKEKLKNKKQDRGVRKTDILNDI
jgi:hypothetical protein